MGVKVTGWKIKELLKDLELQRDSDESQFSGAFTSFKDEQKEAPTVLMDRIRAADLRIARLQTAQALFNVVVKVRVNDEEMSMCEAIKRHGGAERAARLWKHQIHASTYERRGYRSTEEERAAATMTVKEITEHAARAAKQVNAHKAAIATGNGVEVELEGFDSALFSS